MFCEKTILNNFSKFLLRFEKRFRATSLEITNQWLFSEIQSNLNLRNCGVLRDLVPFEQFKKREKHPWRSVNFSKVAGFKPHVF